VHTEADDSFQVEDRRVYNSAALIDRKGHLVAVYRKVQLFGALEASYFTPGDQYVVTSVGGLTIGLAICYDIEFPEFSRALRRRGVELVLVPTANMAPYWEVPKTLVRARALENGISVAYANHSGCEGALHFTGLSGIAGPDGIDLARAGPNGEVLLVADIPTDMRPDTLSTQLSDLRVPTAL
jgi:predicted amidohydrolase